jgi:peptidoglycan/LPS O-acetylase OafA/YrhL
LTKKIESIQALRGLAITAVLLHHLSITTDGLRVLGLPRTLNTGWIGVELFFIVSGYVVSMSLFKSRYSLDKFYTKRAFRLWPTMIFFICLSVFLSILVKNYFPDSMYMAETGTVLIEGIQAMLGLTTISTPHPTYYYGAMWSLAVEEQFYAALGAIVLAVRFVGAKSADQIRHALGSIAISMAAIIPAARIIHLAEPSLIPNGVVYLFSWRFEYLFAGVALFSFKTVLDRIFSKVLSSRWARPTFLALLFFPFLFAGIAEGPLHGDSFKLVVAVYPTLLVCFSGAIFMATHETAVTSLSWLKTALRFLGERSYSIYVLHFPVMVIAWMIFSASHGTHFSATQFVLVVAICVPLASFVFKYIEIPMTDLGHRLAERPAGALNIKITRY